MKLLVNLLKFIKTLAPTPLIIKYPDILDVWSPTVREKILKGNEEKK